MYCVPILYGVNLFNTERHRAIELATNGNNVPPIIAYQSSYQTAKRNDFSSRAQNARLARKSSVAVRP